MVWKEADEYRWLAVYSNKWRDEDSPPEILAEAAHKEFVDAVDKGDWPYPEAWLWHVPGTRFGVADFVAYDDNGFALASGLVDGDKVHIAESLSKDDDLATSHGMPVKEIERDTEDSTIITRYRSIEISPLPREAAANKYGTGYEILREVKMAIPENKRPWFEDKLGAKGLDDLEARLADKAKELEGLEIESKEESLEEESLEAEGTQEEVEEVETEAEPKEIEAPVEEPPNYVTADEMVQVFETYMKPLVEQVASLTGQVEEQEKELKALRKSDDEKLKETLADTPAASLFDRIDSVIGSKETLVDGRVKLAKAGPKETEDIAESPTHVPLINEFMSQSWGPNQ
jgi:hypothetical protein